MSHVEKLDLMGVASLGAVAAALLVGWIVTSQNAAAHATRHAVLERPVTLTEDGSMKLDVTAGRGNAGAPEGRTTLTASARPSGGPSLEVSLPVVLRP
jgi:hypothetical protein